MTEAQYKAEIERLRAENARLQALAASNIKVERRRDKEGRDWIGVKGIPGTGWGLSAEPRGWSVFLKEFDSIKAQIQALL